MVALTAFVGPVSTVLVPKIISDELIGGKNFHRIILILVVVLLANLLRSSVKTIFNERYNPYCQTQIRKSINIMLMEKTQKLDRSFFDNPTFYNKYSRALEQADSGVISFVDNFFILFDRFVYITTVLTIIMTLDKLLILLSLLCVLVLFIFNTRISQYRYDTEKNITENKRRANYAKRIHYLPDYAEDMRTSSSLKHFLKSKYLVANQQMQDTIKRRSSFLSFLAISDEELRTIILQFVTMLYLAFRILNNDLEVSAFVALFMATMQLSFEFFSFINCFNGFYKVSLYTEDLIDVLNQKSEIENSNQPTFSDKININTIDICHLYFQYPGSDGNVLKDINMHLKKGQRVALVGYNGAGKSTLIKMLLRLYDPQAGEIKINGEDIRSYEVSSIREKIGVVFQNYHCYAMSIAENVLMKQVDNEEDQKRVVEALKKSDLYEYVMQLPNGINTELTREYNEEGTLLSGGQNQKLALARVFASEGKEFLIMDEASSALDPISERKINQSILEYTSGKTLLLISHRLSIAKEMDYIYYMEQGEILECGTHKELIRKNKKYAAMYNAQAEYYQS